MKFSFTQRTLTSKIDWDPHFKSQFDVYTTSKTFLGSIYETNNGRGWVAGVKNRITGNVIFKRGFPSKLKAAERLYDEAVINAI